MIQDPNMRGLLPSERGALRDKQDEERKKALTEAQDTLKRNLRIVGSTPEGLYVLSWLRDQCQGGQPILGAVNGQMDEKATMYQAMRLNLWISIRRLLNFNILKEIEYEPDQIS